MAIPGKAFALKNIKIYPNPAYTRFYKPYSIWNGDHISSETYFYFVTEGELILTVEDNNYIVRPYHLVLLPRNRRHTYVLPPSKKLSLWRCAFNAEAEGEDFFEKYGFAADNHVVKIEKYDILEKLFAESSESAGSGNELFFRLASTSKIVKIIAIYADARIKQMPSNPMEFEKITNYMVDHLGEKLTLDELSKEASMDPTYFVRKFKKKMGVSPLKYYDDLKVKKSIELLTKTDIPINKIGDNIGNDSPLYFSQFFKNHIGVSPMEYRKLFKR